MKIDDYGISCSIAIRSLDGIKECGPFFKIDDIPDDMFERLIWISVSDHSNNETIYIRGPDESGSVSTQLIFDQVVRYKYYIHEPLSKAKIIELISDVISRYKSDNARNLQRLEAIEKKMV